MPQKIEEAVAKYRPDFLKTNASMSLAAVHDELKSIEQTADEMRLAEGGPPKKLPPAGKRCQQMIGDLKFIERVLPGACLPLHRLSCVMSNPPATATRVCEHLLKYAYVHRHTGITFGGGGVSSAPRVEAKLSCEHVRLAGRASDDLEIFGDATWKLHNVYGLIATYYGGTIYGCTRRISIICDSSMQAEAVPTAKAGELAAWAREVQRALGVPPRGPTLIGTDNWSNMLVARDMGSAKTSKHFLRMYCSIRDRQRRREVTIAHVPDTENPSDFLTKWLPAKKFLESVRRATNGDVGLALFPAPKA